MKKAISIFFLLGFLSGFFLLYADEDPDVIGIVFTVKGNLVLINSGEEEELTPGVKIFSSSLIRLTEGAGRAKIQIITAAGPVVYSRFPVTFNKTAFASLSTKQQDNYVASIGGTVLTGRSAEADDSFLGEDDDFGDSSLADKIFDWYMDLEVLAEGDIKNGFTLVLSKDKSSKENYSLDPLYFKLKENIDFTDISFEVMKDHTFATVYENGVFTEKDGGLVFSFDCFEYEYDIPYITEVALTFPDGSSDYWEFGFTITGSNKIKEIDAEVLHRCTGKESDFEKELIRAQVYREYKMKLYAMKILKDQGLDIEDMFN